MISLLEVVMGDIDGSGGDEFQYERDGLPFLWAFSMFLALLMGIVLGRML